jgi:protoporphyrin/coproporphyrin ferrochelatase
MTDQNKKAYLIANFGGPRNLAEVSPFLQALLTDREVVRSRLPAPVHALLFNAIARLRARRIRKDYQEIGGRSPIYQDTEAVASLIREKVREPVVTFHRYLIETHADFIKQIGAVESEEIRVFPLFPQFTYATTGSVAKWFDEHLSRSVVNRLRWIKSYPAHPSFLRAHQQNIRQFLDKHQLKDQETILLFSAHGVPRKFVEQGDIYQKECQDSFHGVMEAFPGLLGRLSYQSKFGPGEWLRPYTSEVSAEVLSWSQGRSHVVFVPISFTSDHIETLFEIEQDYMPLVRQAGLQAHRVPGLTLNASWIEAIVDILSENNLCGNRMLLRN